MRRVAKVAIGSAITAFTLTLAASTTQTWIQGWMAKNPGMPLPAGQEALARFAGLWYLWGPWLTLLAAIILGAIAVLARERRVIVADDAAGIGPPPSPRTWHALLVGVFAAPLAAAAGLLLLAIVAALMGWTKSLGVSISGADLATAATKPTGLLTLVIGMELAFAAIAYAMATGPPGALRERLALRTPRLRWWAWPILAAGTLATHAIAILIVGTLTGEPPSALTATFDTLSKLRGAMAVLVVLAVSVPPGIAEELLFRGYVQTRFLQRWHPAAAISLAALLFAMAHMDLGHAAFVFPLGLWLGWVAWLTRSVFPAMFCHALTNAVLMIDGLLGSDTLPTQGWITWDGKTVAALIVSLVVLAVGILAITRHGRLPHAETPTDAPT